MSNDSNLYQERFLHYLKEAAEIDTGERLKALLPKTAEAYAAVLKKYDTEYEEKHEQSALPESMIQTMGGSPRISKFFTTKLSAEVIANTADLLPAVTAPAVGDPLDEIIGNLFRHTGVCRMLPPEMQISLFDRAYASIMATFDTDLPEIKEESNSLSESRIRQLYFKELDEELSSYHSRHALPALLNPYMDARLGLGYEIDRLQRAGVHDYPETYRLLKEILAGSIADKLTPADTQKIDFTVLSILTIAKTRGIKDDTLSQLLRTGTPAFSSHLAKKIIDTLFQTPEEALLPSTIPGDILDFIQTLYDATGCFWDKRPTQNGYVWITRDKVQKAHLAAAALYDQLGLTEYTPSFTSTTEGYVSIPADVLEPSFHKLEKGCLAGHFSSQIGQVQSRR